MKTHQIKQLWKDGNTILNAWLTIPSPWTAEVMAQSGFDALTIDMQHGLADFQVAFSMLQAMSASNTVPLVRVPWNDPAMIMRILDAGAEGIICPMVNSRAEAETFVGACRYAPAGFRSGGALRAALKSENYLAIANELILTFAMIETAQGLAHLDEIVSTPGLDGVYIGPLDLSLSLGLTTPVNFEDPILRRAMDNILKAAVQHGRMAGAHAGTPANALTLADRGFHLVTAASDTALLKESARAAFMTTSEGLIKRPITGH